MYCLTSAPGDPACSSGFYRNLHSHMYIPTLTTHLRTLKNRLIPFFFQETELGTGCTIYYSEGTFPISSPTTPSRSVHFTVSSRNTSLCPLYPAGTYCTLCTPQEQPTVPSRNALMGNEFFGLFASGIQFIMTRKAS